MTIVILKSERLQNASPHKRNTGETNKAWSLWGEEKRAGMSFSTFSEGLWHPSKKDCWWLGWVTGGDKGDTSASKEEGELTRRCFRVSLAQCDLLSHHGTRYLIRSPLGQRQPDVSLITSVSVLCDENPGFGRRQ